MLRAVGASAVVMAVLVVLPMALVAVGRAVWWDWAAIIAQPLSAPGALTFALGVGWLVWAVLIWTVVADLAAAVRGRHQRPRLLPVPVFTAVTAAVSGILLAFSAGRTGGAPGGAHATVSTVLDDHVRTPDAGSASARTQPFLLTHDETDVLAGVPLPGGWLPGAAVGAIAAAVTLRWREHRRAYQPKPLQPAPDHIGLPPLPATVQRLLRAVDADTSASEDATDEEFASAMQPRLDATLPWFERLPTGEVPLSGPGAADAARGLLVTTAAAPDNGVTIWLTTASAVALLGRDAVQHLHPGSTAVQSGPATGRSGPIRLYRDQDPEDRSDVTITLVLAAAAATGTRTDRGLNADPRTGDEPRPRIVRIHGAAAGVPWTVAGDGTVTHTAAPAAGPPIRLPVLNQATALDILAALEVLPELTPSNDRTAGATGDTGPAPAAARPDAATDCGLPAGPPATPVPGAARRLVIQILGDVAVRRPHPDGSLSPIDIRRTAARELLVLLTIHRTGISGDDLIEAIWPEVTRKAATNRFRTTMYELRTALRAAAGQPVLIHDEPATPTSTNRGGARLYRLQPSAVEADLWQLHDLLDDAAATINPARRRELLNAAASTAAGELATGWSHAWLPPHRERTVARLIDAYTFLADTEPDHDAAIALLRAALRHAPYNEALYRNRIRRHVAAGDHAGAALAAATLTEHLGTAGLTPQPVTASLITALTQSSL
ncbi:AfsR/SARP family transcriptional regulator [Dactylosporangium matsuzakiense]|uniref:AfsR/SARP family transcriptional regulator n=1 Tax=Dactylosporangium matsuzakiense TaxID=53360 RepID=UPI0021C35296|nr:hypothetical protein [Dactylosporangium matsuzakiense]UWZ44613.1 hypothetical protein Dmats_45980 [Dactylosporangium matsuzakiense]